jgi:hypothetical protein
MTAHSAYYAETDNEDLEIVGGWRVLLICLSIWRGPRQGTGVSGKSYLQDISSKMWLVTRAGRCA